MGAKAAEFRAGKVSGPFEDFCWRADICFFSLLQLFLLMMTKHPCSSVLVHKVLCSGSVVALDTLHPPAKQAI